MTESVRQLLIEKYAQVLHRVLIEIRNLSNGQDNAERIQRLADIVHNVPLFLVGRDDFVARFLRSELERYEAKYGFGGFTQILDMDEQTFAAHYGDTHWNWPEPEATTVKS